MKNVLMMVLTVFLLSSCSDKLTESKVEEIIDECLEKKPPYGKKTIRTGELSYLSSDEIMEYEELAKLGLLQIEEKIKSNGWTRRKYHIISLTNEAQPYIIETTPLVNGTKNVVRLYTYELDEVGGIREIPSMNMSEVSVTFKKSDKTPFYDVLETDKTEFQKRKITMTKTENKGWVYCD